MTNKAEHAAHDLLDKHGTEAETIATREYETALEIQDIKQQGYWLDILDTIKALKANKA